jgi:hypothetical protein
MLIFLLEKNHAVLWLPNFASLCMQGLRKGYTGSSD